MTVADVHAARQFLADGAPPEAFEWLDDQGRAVPDRLPHGCMVRLRKRTERGFVSVRIAVEDLPDLVDVLPPGVWRC